MSELSTELGQLTEGDIASEDQMIRQESNCLEHDFIPLSPDEWALLKSLEKTVVAGGEALIEIRDKKLYRSTEDGKPQTWEEYCRRFFNKSKQYIDKMIRAAEVKRHLTETKVSVPVEAVSHLEAMHGLSSNEIVQVAEAATETAKKEQRKPTTKDYKDARAKVEKPKPGKQPAEIENERPNKTKPGQRNRTPRNTNSETRCLSIEVFKGGPVGAVEEAFTVDGNAKPAVTKGPTTILSADSISIDQRQAILFGIGHLDCSIKVVMMEKT